MAKDDKKSTVRISAQFRARNSMHYDFICDKMRVTISLSQSNASGDAKSGEWSADAVAKQMVDPPKMTGVGPNRGDAVQALSALWSSKNGAPGFPSLDWLAIREALVAVRAI